MNTTLGTAQREQYREDGYLVLPGFLSRGELAELGAAIDQALSQIGRQRVADHAELAETDGYTTRVTLQRLNLWRVNATVRRYLHHPELGLLLCSLAGIDGVRVWHDQTFFKPPWGAPTAFHLDLPNWPFSAPEALQIWIALDDATLENGCLYYVPGSHRVTNADVTTSIRDDLGAIFRLYPELAKTEPVPVPVEAGTAIVHSGLTVHGAGANLTPRWRRAMTCQYMPDGGRFNGRPSILSQAQLAALRTGDLMDDDSYVPLVWRR